MNKWFYFNIAVLALAIWNIINSKFFTNMQIHILVGFIGLLFILFNWTRHAVFSTIRSTPDRNKKIKYAKLSKKVVHIHKWTGTTALFIILTHAALALDLYGFHWNNTKVVSGLLAVTVLIGVVISGWMRRIKPSLTKRLFHLYMGMAMILLIVLHLIA